jgi:hypothetical protein
MTELVLPDGAPSSFLRKLWNVLIGSVSTVKPAIILVHLTPYC